MPKSIEDIEAEMNLRRVQANSRAIKELERAQSRATKPRKRKIWVLRKILVLFLVILAALLLLAWMVLQRTNIYIGLGAVTIPGLTA